MQNYIKSEMPWYDITTCNRNPWGIVEKKSFCYAQCCAAELRNITEIPEYIQILKAGSLKNDWEHIYLTHSKITTIESNTFKG